MSPSLCLSKVPIIFNKVLFPLPLCPIIALKLPCSISRSIPFRTVVLYS